MTARQARQPTGSAGHCTGETGLQPSESLQRRQSQATSLPFPSVGQTSQVFDTLRFQAFKLPVFGPSS